MDVDDEQERFVADAFPSLVATLTHQFGDRWLAEELAQEAFGAGVRSVVVGAAARLADRLDVPGWGEPRAVGVASAGC